MEEKKRDGSEPRRRISEIHLFFFLGSGRRLTRGDGAEMGCIAIYPGVYEG
jgi:hypothetical protein